MTLIAVLYCLVAGWLALYGFNALFLTALFFRSRINLLKTRPLTEVAESELPTVTIQLPIYNEKYVAARLIDSVCRMEYPRNRFEVQVLDDSTDNTVQVVARRVRYWQRHGVTITHVRRPQRTEYKAGALRYGMNLAKGELIAVFDADFCPPSDWLRRTVDRFLQPDGESIGMVQTRWTHLNANYSPLTRAQALALDGHFGVEQASRAHNGFLFSFNGTAGIWRRACIESAGGWSGETLSEDLDLSYRAQLGGWRLHYDPSITAPAEIPAQIASFKRQQFRWAKGSMQVARRLVPTLLKSSLPPLTKLEGLLHLTAYSLHPLTVILLLLSVPLLWYGWPAGFARNLEYLSVASAMGLGAPFLYFVAQMMLYGTRAGMGRYRWMPVLILLGTGVALSNTQAVVDGLFGRPGGEFQRTPKFRLEDGRGSWRKRDYVLGVEWTSIGELALASYGAVGCVIALVKGLWFVLPFMILYLLAFGYVGGVSLWQNWVGVRRLEKRQGLGWLEL